MSPASPEPAADDHVLITDARYGRTADAAMRQRRYLITMGCRVAAFLLGVLVPGPLRWVFFGLAAFLPAAAVLLANAVNQRMPAPLPTADPTRPALPSQAAEGVTVVPGEIVDDGPAEGPHSPVDA